MTELRSKFHLGQTVKATSFTDCFNQFIPERPNLIVSDIRLVEGEAMPPYFRVKADSQDGFGYVEAAERFFEAQPIIGQNCTACIGTAGACDCLKRINS